jgi:hypothetical protein
MYSSFQRVLGGGYWWGQYQGFEVLVSSWGDKWACKACKSFFASQRFCRLAKHFFLDGAQGIQK